MSTGLFIWDLSDEVRGRQLKASGIEQSNIDYILPLACYQFNSLLPHKREEKGDALFDVSNDSLILLQQVW